MEKHSKRWIETDERLQRITLELINVSDVDHVSVQAVCKHANINRSTFYEHYADVYDLLDKLEMKNRKRIMARYKPGEVAVFSAESFVPFLSYIKENRQFYFVILKTRTSFPIRTGLDNLLNHVFRPLCAKAGITDEEEIMYHLVFFQAGFTMCLRRWVENGCQESVEELAEFFAKWLSPLCKEQ